MKTFVQCPAPSEAARARTNRIRGSVEIPSFMQCEHAVVIAQNTEIGQAHHTTSDVIQMPQKIRQLWEQLKHHPPHHPLPPPPPPPPPPPTLLGILLIDRTNALTRPSTTDSKSHAKNFVRGLKRVISAKTNQYTQDPSWFLVLF